MLFKSVIGMTFRVIRAGLVLTLGMLATASAQAQTGFDEAQSEISPIATSLAKGTLRDHFANSLSEELEAAWEACRLEQAKACFFIAATALASDQPAVRDGGMEKLAQACDLDFGLACEEMARLSDDRAMYLDRACALGRETACVSEVVFDETQPVAERVTELEYMCSHGMSAACVELALFLSDEMDSEQSAGIVMQQDLQRAFQLNTDACMIGDQRACFNLSRMVDPRNSSDGWEQFPKDPALTTELLEVSCDIGKGDGCQAMGGRYETGEDGAPLDLVLAWRYYLRACRFGTDCEPLVRVATELDARS